MIGLISFKILPLYPAHEHSGRWSMVTCYIKAQIAEKRKRGNKSLIIRMIRRIGIFKIIKVIRSWILEITGDFFIILLNKLD